MIRNVYPTMKQHRKSITWPIIYWTSQQLKHKVKYSLTNYSTSNWVTSTILIQSGYPFQEVKSTWTDIIETFIWLNTIANQIISWSNYYDMIQPTLRHVVSTHEVQWVYTKHSSYGIQFPHIAMFSLVDDTCR